MDKGGENPIGIGPIIKEAKDAQLGSEPKKSQPIDESRPKEIPPEVADLATHFKDQTEPEKREATPQRLDTTLKWHHVDEAPDDIPDLERHRSQRTKKESIDVKTRAQEILDAKPAIRGLIIDALYYSTPSINWQDYPTEINNLIVLMDNFGMVNDYREITEGMKWGKRAVIKALRTDDNKGDRGSWSGYSSYHKPQAADQILDNLSYSYRAERIEQSDLDICILTAFACADPLTAFKLMEKADKFLPKVGKDAISDALLRHSEPGGTIDRLYDIYPRDFQIKLDGIMASFSQPGGIFAEKQSAKAAELKAIGEKRLRERLQEFRDNFYFSQTVADTPKRESELEDKNLGNLISQMPLMGKDVESIKETLRGMVSHLVDGRIANSIAQELVDRLYPQWTTQQRFDAVKKYAMEQEGGEKPINWTLDTWRYVFGSEIESGDLPKEKKAELVRQCGTPNERGMLEMMYDKFIQHEIGVKELVGLLRYPDAFMGIFQKAVRQQRAELERRLSSRQSSRDQDELSRFSEVQTQFIKKFVGGVTYLQAVTENPEVLRILQDEFGLGDLVRQENLEKISQLIQETLKDEVDKDTGLTLYESFLKDGQFDEDRRTAELIASARQSEIDRIANEKADRLPTVLEDVTQTSKGNLEVMQGKLSSSNAKRQELELSQRYVLDLQNDLNRLEEEQEALKHVEVEDSVIKRMLKPKAITSLEKATKIADLLASQTANEQELTALTDNIASLQAVIETIGTVDQTEITRLTEQIAALEKLRTSLA